MHQQNPSKSTKATEPPTEQDRAAFLAAIPPRIFGERHFFAWHGGVQQFVLCETTELVEDGRAFAAYLLPFN